VAQKSENYGFECGGTSRSSPAAGNGIFRCRDRAPKIATKRANAHRDKNSGTEGPEIPAETPYLALYRKRAVCKGWMVETVGLELGTHHPVIEPASAERIVGQAEFGRLLMFFCP
jgi:hypothetical protein